MFICFLKVWSFRFVQLYFTRLQVLETCQQVNNGRKRKTGTFSVSVLMNSDWNKLTSEPCGHVFCSQLFKKSQDILTILVCVAKLQFRPCSCCCLALQTYLPHPALYSLWQPSPCLWFTSFPLGYTFETIETDFNRSQNKHYHIIIKHYHQCGFTLGHSGL